MKSAAFLLSIVAPIFSFCELSLSDVSLQKLMEGNERFIKEEPIHPNQTKWHRVQYSEKQEPFAVVVCCSDSRVSPEIIFDRGLGDTFVVRVAGNVVGALGMESVRFAVDNLKAPLIMVLGHQNCGAIKAALEGGGASRDIPEIAKIIDPSIDKAKKMSGDNLEHAIQLNAVGVKKKLEEDAFLKGFIDSGKLKIVSAYYDFDTGKVTLLDKAF